MLSIITEWLARSKRRPLTPGETRQLARELNAPILDPLEQTRPGFTSKHVFSKTAMADRLAAIAWFAGCGGPIGVDITPPLRLVTSWHEALSRSARDRWSDVQLEAQNQLSAWLSRHARDRDRQWNDLVRAHKEQVIEPVVVPGVRAALTDPAVLEAVLPSVQWDCLGALMEDSYLDTGHAAHFFLELLMIYEAGHFPCGWEGKWPRGTLLVY